MKSTMKKRSSAEAQTASATGRVARSARTEARLPHERDQSTRQPATPPTRVMKRAHDDVQRGLVDTDTRGDNARRAFARGTRSSGTSEVVPPRPRKLRSP
jgi:hypothetical protein